MNFIFNILLSILTVFCANTDNLGSFTAFPTCKMQSLESKFALGTSDVSTTVIEEYVKGNPDTEFSKTWVENRNIIYGSLLVANLTDAAITAYANKAKQMESLYLKETGTEFAEIGSVAKGGIVRQNWNGYANIFKANADEVAEAAVKIKNYRTANNLKGGNYGYLEGTVNGKVVDSKMWRSVSNDIAEKEIHIFTAIETEGAGGSAWLRITDSEYRMLNNLANDLGGKAGMKFPNVQGELKIVSENPYCISCQGIIQQFNEIYPNVKLILIDGAK